MFVINFLGLLMKNYMEIKFFDSVFIPKTKRKKMLFYLSFFIIALSFAFFLTFLNPNTIEMSLISIIVIFIFTYFYQDRILKKLVFIIFIIVFITISELLSGLILLLSNITIKSFETDLLYSFVQLILSSIFLYLSILIIKHLKNKIYLRHLNIVLLLFPISSLLVIYSFFYVSENSINSTFKYIFIIIIAMFILALNFFLIYVIKRLLKIEVDIQRVKFQNDYKSMSRQYQKDLEQLHKNTKKIQHDMKTYLIHIQGLLKGKNYSECYQYINHLLNRSQEFENLISTGYNGLDAVISSKLMIAQSKKIHVYSIITLPYPHDLFIDEFDISIICANIFDNAIEAVQKCSFENQYIDFQIHYDGVLSYIRICCKNPTIDDTLNLKTTKKDQENHGFGIKNIEEAAEKWNGMVQYAIKDNLFSIVVSLQNYNK